MNPKELQCVKATALLFTLGFGVIRTTYHRILSGCLTHSRTIPVIIDLLNIYPCMFVVLRFSFHCTNFLNIDSHVDDEL